MGAAACLVNTAIAVAGNPVEMAVAFKEAVIAGRRAYEAGLGIQADTSCICLLLPHFFLE